jgi:hypothetical protein
VRRRSLWIGAGLVATLVAVGAGVTLVAVTATRAAEPDDAAADYLAALAAGDGARAVQLLAEPAGDLDPAELLAGASELLSAPEVVAVDRSAGDEGRAEASVRFALDGQRWDATLALRSIDGQWRVESGGLAPARVTTDIGDRVAIASVALPAGDVRLLPAVYPVSAEPAALLDGEASLRALPEGAGSAPMPAVARVDATLSPDAAAQAQGFVEEYARTCTLPASSVPAACGLRIPWSADLAALDRIAYRIERMPNLSIAGDGASFAATGGVLVATATGAGHDGSPASATYRNDDWSFRGIVRVEGDQLVLGVR